MPRKCLHPDSRREEGFCTGFFDGRGALKVLVLEMSAAWVPCECPDSQQAGLRKCPQHARENCQLVTVANRRGEVSEADATLELARRHRG